MKQIGRITTLAFFFLFAASCNYLKETANNEDLSIETVFITAFTEDGDSNTRTGVIDGGESVYWQPEDAIKLFRGNSSSKLTTTITSESKIATFSGQAPAASDGDYIGLYPYSEDASCSGGVVTVSLAPFQIAQAGSFSKDTFIALGRSSTTEMGFYSLCGGFRFTVAQPGIHRIIFHAANGENIAGTAKVSFDNGRPVINSISEGCSSIVLDAPDGESFQTGKWYYFVAFPTELKQGFKLSFVKTGASGNKVFSSPVIIKRSVFGEKKYVDGGAEFVEHAYCDLGLPSGTQWATCNYGAGQPEELGSRYAWGITEEYFPKQKYKWEDDNHKILKYCTDPDKGAIDNKSTLDDEDDVVNINYGEGWHIPTKAQFKELNDYCSWTYTTKNSVIGYEVKGPNGKSIFLPMDSASACYYGSSSLVPDECQCAYHTHLTSSSYGYSWMTSRSQGMYLRPVFGGRTAIQTISLVKNNITVLVNGHAQAVAEVTPSNAWTDGLIWESLNDGIATVNEAGVIRGVSSGTTQVLVYSGDTTKAICEVTVLGGDYNLYIPQAVDMGLPSKTHWADHNIGAILPEDFGSYYAWGDSYSKVVFDYKSYVASNIVYSKETDAVSLAYGPEWSTPSIDQIEELLSTCTYEVTTVNGVVCHKITSPTTKNSIYIPYSGDKLGNNIRNANAGASLWSSTESSGDSSSGQYLRLYNKGEKCQTWEKYFGMAIRPVRIVKNTEPEENSIITYVTTNCSALDFSGYTQSQLQQFFNVPILSNTYDEDENIGVIVFDGVLRAISARAFSGCNSLREIHIPEGVSSLGDSAFSNNSALSTVELPTSLVSICDYCFLNCSLLKNITIPSSINEIGVAAFSGCTNLRRVFIPKGVPKIPSNCFNGCSKLEEVIIEEGSVLKSIENSPFSDCTSLSELHLPEGLLEIGNYALFNTAISEISLPSSLQTLGNGVFGKSGIISITIPDTVKSVGEAMFKTCNKLKTATILSPITNMDYWFSDCESLLSVTLPGTVTSIEGAFSGCYQLAEINLPSSLKTVSRGAFRFCKNLKRVTLPTTIQFIDKEAFYACYRLSEINFPEGLSEIGEAAFGYCDMPEVVFPSTLNTIGKNAFSNNSRLKYLNIPYTVKTLGDGAFSCCDNLQTVDVDCPSVPPGAFSGTNLTSVHLGRHVGSCGNLSGGKLREFTSASTSIDASADGRCLVAYDGTLLACATAGLTNYIIPQETDNYTVEYINTGAFYDSILKTIVVPSTVRGIGRLAFNVSSTSVTTTDIFFLSPTPPELNYTNSVIEGSMGGWMVGTAQSPIYKSITIHVPEQSIASYQSAWNSLSNEFVAFSTLPDLNTDAKEEEITPIDLGLSIKWASSCLSRVSWGYINPSGRYSSQMPFYYGSRPELNNQWPYYSKYCSYTRKSEYSDWYPTELYKYNTDSTYGNVDNKTCLDIEDDVANFVLGGNWRMPTKQEAEELLENCEIAYNDGKNITLISKINGNSISLGEACAFWTSSLCVEDPRYAYCFGLYKSLDSYPYSIICEVKAALRCVGLCVFAVCD